MSISVTNSLTLRIFYKNFREMTNKSERLNATTGRQSMADASALRNAIRNLQDFKFEDATVAQVQEKLKAFTDTMNYAIESSTKYGSNSTSVKNAANSLKRLNAEYAKELQNIGITVQKDGTLSLYDSAAKNYSRSKFTKFFDKESKYLNDAYDAAKKITRRVDISI